MTEQSEPMPNEPSSHTRMKRFYSDRLHSPDRDDIMAELAGGNDRSAIITLASLADGALESLLVRNLPGLKEADQKNIETAFRHDGGLGTFSARIDMAFYLQLIDATLKDQLTDLRAMRNAVAHTKRRVTFEHDELRNVAKRILSPKGKFNLLSDTTEGIRNSFIAEAMLIYTSLVWGRDEAIRRARDRCSGSGGEPPF